jgi:hypothetical protein
MAPVLVPRAISLSRRRLPGYRQAGGELSYSPGQYHEITIAFTIGKPFRCTESRGGASAVSLVIPVGSRRIIPPQAYRPSKGERAMAYGRAERNLALIRQLEAETEDLLGTLGELDPEQSAPASARSSTCSGEIAQHELFWAQLITGTPGDGWGDAPLGGGRGG